jgi:adenosylcobinamide amidohydrolase
MAGKFAKAPRALSEACEERCGAPRFYASSRAQATVTRARRPIRGASALTVQGLHVKVGAIATVLADLAKLKGMHTLYERAGVRVAHRERCVVLSAEGPHACVSHAPFGGAFSAARTIAIHETRNDELTLDVDPIALLATRMAAVDPRGVGMWTSRRVGSAVVIASQASSEPDVHAVALVTAGLSNAVRVGDTPGPLAGWGTINLACRVSVPLAPAALIEALALAVEARTTAVIEARVPSRRSERIATGTGTDCAAVMAPEGAAGREPLLYAGKHTAIGHVIGDAVLRATEAAIAQWKIEVLK